MLQDVLYLVEEDPAAHGIFDTPTETAKMVYCTVRSVGMSEYYQALAHGLQPTMVFILADAADYNGEKVCLYHDKRYRIIRTYTTGGRIELTVEEGTVDGRIEASS